MERQVFASRGDGGRQLAALLSAAGFEDPVVAPVLRGGIEVALPIIDQLHGTLLPLVLRKVGHPWQPELGLGAIDPDGELVLDEEMQKRFMVTEQAIRAVVETERKELARRKALYQLSEDISIEGKTVIAVDDGLATGLTAKCVAGYLRRRGAEQIVLAVPVGSDQALAAAGPCFDRVFCIHHSAQFTAVSRWYQTFGQLGDRRIVDLLAAAQGNRE